jgi:hypothetical protein
MFLNSVACELKNMWNFVLLVEALFSNRRLAVIGKK